MGFVIDSPAMARALADTFGADVPTHAYRLRTTDDGGLRWEERHDGEALVFATEPRAGLGQRILVALLSLLPIDWLL
jgi:putative cardiolipin synthase